MRGPAPDRRGDRARAPLERSRRALLAWGARPWLICSDPAGRILGVHILGLEAEDLIHIAAVAVRAGLRRADLAARHYVFPTLAGSVFDAMGE